MARKELQTNLKVIQSGNAPTTANLPQGHLGFGKVGGVPKMYGNSDGTVVAYGGLSETEVDDKIFAAIGKVIQGSY